MMPAAGGRIAGWAARISNLPWRSIVSEPMDRMLLVLKAACFVHVVDHYLVSVALVRGSSMIPTFNVSGDIVLIDRITSRWGSVSVGDVVLLRSPQNPSKTVAKRVLGLEGDSVSFLKNPVLGTKLETVVVPKGHVWVQGDNIYESRDSREFGPVPHGLIQGRAFLRVWPPEDFGLIKQNV